MLRKEHNDLEIERTVINYWTQSEIDTLTKLYPNQTNMNISKVVGHSKNSVLYKARELGLTKRLWWTESDVEILEHYYPTMGAKKLVEIFLPNRSEGSVRKKAHTLQIPLNDDVSIKIRDKNLKGRLTSTLANHPDFQNNKDLRNTCRNRLGGWRRSVMELYGGKCQLTGETDNLSIHHIVPFANIFNGVLDAYEREHGFKRASDISKCIEINGFEAVEQFISEVVSSHRAEHGIVLKSEIHDLFHSQYGTYYFTKDDFYLFLESCRKGVVYHDKRA